MYGPDVGYLARRRVEPAGTTEVCLIVSGACLAHAGFISLAYVYIPRLNAATILHQVHFVKS